MRRIDLEDGNCRAADRGAADENCSAPAKMAIPFVSAGIEEPCPLSRLGIDAGKVGTLVMIVSKTSQREISVRRRAAMLFGDDMV